MAMNPPEYEMNLEELLDKAVITRFPDPTRRGDRVAVVIEFPFPDMPSFNDPDPVSNVGMNIIINLEETRDGMSKQIEKLQTRIEALRSEIAGPEQDVPEHLYTSCGHVARGMCAHCAKVMKDDLNRCRNELARLKSVCADRSFASVKMNDAWNDMRLERDRYYETIVRMLGDNRLCPNCGHSFIPMDATWADAFNEIISIRKQKA